MLAREPAVTGSSTVVPKAWAALAGRWSFEEADVRYEGPTEPEARFPYGLAISDVALRAGIASTSVEFETFEGAAAGLALGFSSEAARYLVAQLGAHQFAYLIARWEPDFGWRTLARAGSIKNLHAGRAYRIDVTIRGQQVRMEVDRVRVLELVLPEPLSGNQVGLYGWGQRPIQFKETEFRLEQPSVFVAMQFSEPFDSLYREVVKPKAEELGFSIMRIDEVSRPGIIFEDIKREIAESQAVIAEITAPNQNVYYELGYAHALNKPTILLAQRGKDLPFDIRSYRVIFYDDTIGGKPDVERALHKHLTSIMEDL